MKTKWAKRIRLGLLLLAGIGAGGGLVGCADEYATYPGYRGGYYASYTSGPYYSPYGYPYRAYAPYYGGPYYGYGSPYYGGPYYGGSSVVISGSRTYTYRDRYGRWHNRRDNRRTRSTTRNVRTRTTTAPQYQSDDENRYYTPR
jgi:hypothetical protein